MATVETHPFEPFLHENTRILMCGTFPPKPNRWSMDFYYPNRINDMWRIWGLIVYGDKEYLVDNAHKTFHLDKIKTMCNEIGLGMTDTGYKVQRLKDNASDKYLQILQPFDLDLLLEKAKNCHSIVVTGELAGETLRQIIECEPLLIGIPQYVNYKNRELAIWRMPSSSRAYPKSIEWKAAYYQQVLDYENKRTEEMKQ